MKWIQPVGQTRQICPGNTNRSILEIQIQIHIHIPIEMNTASWPKKANVPGNTNRNIFRIINTNTYSNTNWNKSSQLAKQGKVPGKYKSKYI